ncbi:hypothetical protein ACGFYV_17390 [Streptomyces sp. NPDC048297]|uniref:WXG100-like domain-containing protein n=1 Tax=Streptomyces sp. NPDC048297 TaxID=3365531 RepID=UPI0037117067
MTIYLPDAFGPMAKMTVGEEWIKTDEDKLREFSDVWFESARQMMAIAESLGPATQGVLNAVGGRVGEQYEVFTREMAEALPGLAGSSKELAELLRENSVQVQYAKLMLLVQMAWTMWAIGELLFFGMPEAVGALVKGVQAVCRQILRSLLLGTLTGVGFMAFSDFAIQFIQKYGTKDRSHWSLENFLSDVVGGGIGGALGGLLSEVGHMVAPKFASHLLGQLAIGGAVGVGSTVLTDLAQRSPNDGMTVGLGAASGAVGNLQGRGWKGWGRFGGHTPDIDTHFDLPKTPEFDGTFTDNGFTDSFTDTSTDDGFTDKPTKTSPHTSTGTSAVTLTITPDVLSPGTTTEQRTTPEPSLPVVPAGKDVSDRWAEVFTASRATVNEVDAPDRQKLLAQAATVVTTGHRPPAIDRRGMAAGSPAEQYARLHDDILHAVAAELLTKPRPGLALTDPAHPARVLSDRLGADLGTRPAGGLPGGAPAHLPAHTQGASASGASHRQPDGAQPVARSEIAAVFEGKGKDREQWYTVTRAASHDGSAPRTYEVSTAGRISTPGNETLPPDGWTRQGRDFVHQESGYVLRASDGQLMRAPRLQQAATESTTVQTAAPAYELRADSRYLYAAPRDSTDTTAYRIRLDAPQDVRAEVPSGVRAEVPSGVRAEVPSGVRAEVPSGVRAEVPAAVHSEVASAPLTAGPTLPAHAGPTLPAHTDPAAAVTAGGPVTSDHAAATLHHTPVQPAAVPVPPPGSEPSGNGTAVGPHPDRLRSIGVPKAGLPQLPEVVRTLRGLAAGSGHTVPEPVWERLPQRLLSNYPYLLRSSDGDRDGLLVPLGKVEALVTLDLTRPEIVAQPGGAVVRPGEDGVPPGEGGVRATGTVSAALATGAHVQREAGATSVTRAGLSANFGIGLPSTKAHLLSVGAGVSGVANAAGRSTSHTADAERGRVEDNRDGATLISWEPRWSVRLRPVHGGRPWEEVAETRVVPGSPDDRAQIWVAKSYLDQAASEQVVATGTQVLRDKLPAHHFVSGLTGLPTLFDHIVQRMEEGGTPVSSDPWLRNELLHRLWNLQSFLDAAVNSEDGYVFRLHDRHGVPVASVAVHTQRLAPGREPRVGATSDLSHIENSRTAIDGTSGDHSLTQSTTLTPASAELDVTPFPFKDPDLGIGLSTSVSQTWTNGDSSGAGRAGLWVMVPRYTGPTAGYWATFAHRAVVSLRSDPADRARYTGSVVGNGLLRLPEPEAFRHGFPVDRTSLREHVTPDRGFVTYREDALTSAPTPEQLAPRPLPRQLTAERYTGVGLGVVEVPESTSRQLYDRIAEQLRPHGFLLPDAPRNRLGGRSWWELGSGLDSRVDNEDLLRKFLNDGLAVHHDRMHQDGLTLVLHRRRGTAGMEFDVDAARITITAERSQPTRFLNSADDHHIVNLAIGMDTASTAVSGSHTVSANFRVKSIFRQLLGGAGGIALSAGRSASDSAFYLSGRPELMEHGSGDVLRSEVTSTYTARIEFQHSGLRGQLRAGRRDPAPVVLADQPAIVRTLPLGDGKQGFAQGTRDTTAGTVLDQAVIFHFDTTGTRQALHRLLPHLDGPQGRGARVMDSMVASLRAHLKEAAQDTHVPGEEARARGIGAPILTDQPFDPGLLRDSHAAIGLGAKLKRSDFVGASTRPFVQGLIKLFLAQATTSTSTSRGLTWIQADVTAGGPNAAGTVNTNGGVDMNHHWQHNVSESYGLQGAREVVHLSFSHVYLYRTRVDLELTALSEKHGKLMWSSRDIRRAAVEDREMMYLLPEPEALALYGKGELPVSDEQLRDAMSRWEDGSLPLQGNTVAAVLARWHGDRTAAGDGAAAGDSATVGDGAKAGDVEGAADVKQPAHFAQVLSERHNGPGSSDTGRLTVWDRQTREAFEQTFGDRFPLDARANPLASLRLPEYLTRQDPGGNILGHASVVSIDHQGGHSTADMIRDALDRAAPGLLTRRPDLWNGTGRHLGRLQGGIDAVQALFSRGRSDAALEDLLSGNGVEFFFTNQIGWFLTDAVKVTVQAELLPGLEVLGERAEAGLELYGHHYVNSSTSASRDAGQGFTVAKLGSGREHGGGGASAAFGTTRHSGVTHSESGVSGQTVYSWNGLYEARVPHRFTVTATRLHLPNRPLNELAVGAFRTMRGLGGTRTVQSEGTTLLHLPAGIARFEPHSTHSGPSTPSVPRDFGALPRLPGDAAVQGVVLDDALPAARRLMARVFGHGENPARYRGSLALPTLMMRSHLTNLLGRVGPNERVRLAAHLFQPGRSAHGVELYLRSVAYDLQVLGEVQETGTGRYGKHQSGTTVSASTDHWRATGGGNGNAGGVLPHTAADTGSGSTSQNRATGATHGAAAAANYRREQHVKQQAPTYLVRLRVQVHLDAEEHRNHLFVSPTRLRTWTSEPINGEMYVELAQGDVDALRAQTGAEARSRPARISAWLRAQSLAPVELAPLLLDAAGAPGADAARADLVVSRALGDRVGTGPRGLALTLDTDRLALGVHRATLAWAVHTLREDHQAYLRQDPAAAPPQALARFEREHADLPERPRPGARTLLADSNADIVATVQAYHRARPDTTAETVAPTPPALAFGSLDPVLLARDIAHNLDAHVRLATPAGRASAESATDQWIGPDGRIRTDVPWRNRNEVPAPAGAATGTAGSTGGLRSDAVFRPAPLADRTGAARRNNADAWLAMVRRAAGSGGTSYVRRLVSGVLRDRPDAAFTHRPMRAEAQAGPTAPAAAARLALPPVPEAPRPAPASAPAGETAAGTGTATVGADAPRSALPLRHSVSAERGSTRVSREESWWLERVADHYLAETRRRAATGLSTRAEVRFTDHGDAAPGPRRAERTSPAFAQAVRAVFERRIGGAAEAAALPSGYTPVVGPAPLGAGSADGTALSPGGRYVTVEVAFDEAPAAPAVSDPLAVPGMPDPADRVPADLTALAPDVLRRQLVEADMMAHPADRGDGAGDVHVPAPYVHVVRLGGVSTELIGGEGGGGGFEALVGAVRGPAEVVLWTDVPRERIEAVRSGGPAAPEERRLYEWALLHGVRLVNVDEMVPGATPGGDGLAARIAPRSAGDEPDLVRAFRTAGDHSQAARLLRQYVVGLPWEEYPPAPAAPAEPVRSAGAA